MAHREKSVNERVPASRRPFVKGLGAAAAALPGVAMLPRWSFAEDAAAMYSGAAIDWKQFSGQTITLAGAIHPWSNAITPLLPRFSKLTGIGVVTDFQPETKPSKWVSQLGQQKCNEPPFPSKFSQYSPVDLPHSMDLSNMRGMLRENHTTPVTTQKVGRNEPCPCGSGKKFKKCCSA